MMALQQRSSDKIILIMDPERKKIFKATKEGRMELLGDRDDLDKIEKILRETHRCFRKIRGHGWMFSDWVER